MPTEILQLTDLHLLADPEAELKGVCTRNTLAQVLELVQQGEAAGRWDLDCVVISGDMTHDEKLETYQALHEMVQPWLDRLRIVPGNHDDRDLIRQVFNETVPADGPFVNFSVETENWKLIGLDSHVPGQLHGHIDAEQLQWLSAELEANTERATVLFLHHPPVSVRSPWLDEIGLKNSDDLLAVVEAFSQVRLVCCGHVHQEFHGTFGPAELLTAPSTSVQFLPVQDELIVDDIPPGFRILRLHQDRHESGVVRLPG